MAWKADVHLLEAPRQPLKKTSLELADPGEHEAIVEVLACGLCHTDLGFAEGSVAPRHALPLVLGHEIVGTIVAAGDRALVGRRVLVPAVMPCGTCAFCAAGRGNACPKQTMPGNDAHGGFASHVLVPSAPLVSLEGAPSGFDLRELSVVADAVSTAYQAIERARLAEGDLAIVMGAGGVGGYAVQIARARGARVLAIDLDRGRLERIACHGASEIFQLDGRPAKELRKDLKRLISATSIPSLRHRIFECSGSPAGQQLAFGLIEHGATMVQVGYCREAIEVRLSNLMAFDATIHGSWGAPVEVYPKVLDLVFSGRVAIAPFIEHAPMSRLDALLDDMAHHRLEKRAVLDPRA